MNIEQAKNTSRAFRLAANRSMELRTLPNGQYEMFLAPGVVCLAFAIEIGIKVFLLQSGIDSHIHDLDKLFVQLTTDLQNSLSAATCHSRAEFDSSLSKSAKAFEEWRYIYEGETANADLHFLTSLSDAIQRKLWV